MVRIESVRFDASGNAVVAASGGISFFIPMARSEDAREAFALERGHFSVAPGLAFLAEIASSGDEFSSDGDFFRSLTAIDEETRARAKAIELCARAEQYSRGLILKLVSKGFGGRVAASVAERLRDEGIVDDSRYARLWARSRAERRAEGPALLAAELRSRGLGEDAVRSAISEIDFDGILARAVDRETARLARRTKKDDRISPHSSSLNDRIIRVLRAQGFNGEKIREELARRATNGDVHSNT